MNDIEMWLYYLTLGYSYSLCQQQSGNFWVLKKEQTYPLCSAILGTGFCKSIPKLLSDGWSAPTCDKD